MAVALKEWLVVFQAGDALTVHADRYVNRGEYLSFYVGAVEVTRVRWEAINYVSLVPENPLLGRHIPV